MASHQFVVSIMGNLNQEFLKSLIKMTDNKLTTLDIHESIKKRIFHFMVECAQNICRTDDKEHQDGNSLFVIGKQGEVYSVFLGSVLDTGAIQTVTTLVDEVNKLSAPELKEKFYEEMTKKTPQNALLMSLIGLYRRTKEKIRYEKFEAGDNNSFLSFQITLSNLKL